MTLSVVLAVTATVAVAAKSHDRSSGGPSGRQATEPEFAAVEVQEDDRHVLRAYILSTRDGADVELVVREYADEEIVQVKSKPAQLEAGARNVVEMTISETTEDPEFEVLLETPALRPGDGFVLHRVRWQHPEPTPDPETEEPQEPDSPDTPDVPDSPDSPDTPDTPDTPDDPETEEPTNPGGQVLSNGCAYSDRGVPSCGAYLGQTYGSNSDPSDFEQEVGRRLGIRRTFYTAQQVDSAVRRATEDLAVGRLPWLSFKLPFSWAEMAAGAGDSWAKDLAAKLGDLDGPVWVAFHHEPEGDGPIGDWTRMQQHLGPIMREQENIGFTVVVTGWHQFYGESQYRLDTIWPETKVDVAGFDIYNQLGVVKDGKENTKGTDLQSSYFSRIQPWAESEGVAWGLAETGFTDKAAEVDPNWIERTHGQLEAAGGVAFAYFNTTLNSIAPWDLGTPTKMESWREAQVGTPLLPGN